MQRNSSKRSAVLSDVNKRKDHPTAEMIYNTVKMVIPSISLGTVYRDLNELCQEGLVLRVPISGGKDRFDSTLVRHAHFYCRKCGKVSDYAFSDEALGKLLSINSEKIESVDLVIRGVCDECDMPKNN